MSLVLADDLLIPLQTEFFALEGISQLLKTIDRIKVKLNPELGIRGVLLTMYDKRNKLSSQVDLEARKHFQDKVYKTVVPRNVRLSEAPSHGMPCIVYDKNCSGSKSYFKLADEFLEQNNQKIGSAGALKKKDLGGLSALFGDIEKKTDKNQLQKNIVAISDLQRNKYQPEQSLTKKKLEELSMSIKENGIIQPIAVRPNKYDSGKFEIVAGERRWLAAQKAGLNKVPVMVLEIDDQKSLEIAIVENVQRQDLNIIEEARGYQRLSQEFDMIMIKFQGLCQKPERQYT